LEGGEGATTKGDRRTNLFILQPQKKGGQKRETEDRNSRLISRLKESLVPDTKKGGGGGFLVSIKGHGRDKQREREAQVAKGEKNKTEKKDKKMRSERRSEPTREGEGRNRTSQKKLYPEKNSKKWDRYRRDLTWESRKVEFGSSGRGVGGVGSVSRLSQG